MAISRYKKSSIIKNNDSDYKKIFASRVGSLGLLQTSTTTFRKLTEQELMTTQYINETWGLGKRLYKFSFQHYGDSQYWWLIALFNGIAIESDIKVGDVIKIPIPLDTILNLYGF